MNRPSAMSKNTQPDFGPLPAFLLALTFVTGLIDAVSFFRLDHIFVANMTGNVVFLAFALADREEFSLAASSIAVIGFLAGAAAGGRLGRSYGAHRARYLLLALTINAALLAGAAAEAAVFPNGNAVTRYGLAAMLAVAMGLQNAAARRLAVPDLTTTVLTMTLVGLAADSHLAGARGPFHWRRIAAVGVMFAGAVVGSLLILRFSTALVIGLAFLIVFALAIAALRFRRSREAWTRA
jgi:uncharacterized membrane protein YoaK (UPF0700 family)